MGIANSTFSWIIEKSMDNGWLEEHELFKKIWEEATDEYGSITLYDELLRYEKYKRIMQDAKDKNSESEISLSDCIPDNYDLIHCQNKILCLANSKGVATYDEYMDIYIQGYSAPKGKRKKVLTIEDIYNRIEKKISKDSIDLALDRLGKETQEDTATRIEKEIADSIKNSYTRMEISAGLRESREFDDMQWVGGLMSYPLNKGYKSRLFSEIKQLAASQYIAEDPSSWCLRKAVVLLIQDLAQIEGIPLIDAQKEGREKTASELFAQLKERYKVKKSSPKIAIREMARDIGLPMIDDSEREIEVNLLFRQLQELGIVRTAETGNTKTALADCYESPKIRKGTVLSAINVVLDNAKSPTKDALESSKGKVV